MNCTNCIDTKDSPLSYTKCERCGKWRPLDTQEAAKVAKRKK